MPRLVVEVYDNETTNFGASTRKAIVHDAAKVGWSWYSRFPGSAFFTLSQSSDINSLIVPGLSHCRIWYRNDATGYGPVLVFAGRIGDADETGDDVVWRAHAYLAELALSRTGYRVMYEGQKISTVVTREWERNKAKGKFKEYGAQVQVKGLMRHVAKGTIQNPQNDAGQGMRLESGFGVIDVPRLLFLYDLSEIGRANTSNNVTFEITRSTTPTFNFWRNRGSAIAGRVLAHPGIVRDFRFVRGVVDIRNDLATIGTKRGQAREIKATKQTGTYGYDLFGRRQDTFPIRTLAGFRNLDDEAGRFVAQKQVAKRAVREASRPTRALVLDVPYQHLEPFDGWDIEDTMKVQIVRGRTNISDTGYRMVGITGIMDQAGYHQTLHVVTENA